MVLYFFFLFVTTASVAAQQNGNIPITTFDGLDYSLNGDGEYLLLFVPECNFRLVAEMVPNVYSNGDIYGTSFTSFTIYAKGKDQPVIKIGMNRNKDRLDVYINGVLWQRLGESRLNGVLMRYNSPYEVIFAYLDGISVTFSFDAVDKELYVSPQLGNNFKGTTLGLFGTYDGDQSNDYTLPDRTVMDINPAAITGFVEEWKIKYS